LVEELQNVPRIGPWTAGAAVADHTHDWSLYPHGDLAVRTWAKAAAPDVDWPTTEPQFAERWRTITGPCLGLATLFTLAWGAHQAATAALCPAARARPRPHLRRGVRHRAAARVRRPAPRQRLHPAHPRHGLHRHRRRRRRIQRRGPGRRSARPARQRRRHRP